MHRFLHVLHDFSFTEMMQQYGMGGEETGREEVSQSLQSTVVMVWAKKGEGHGVNHGPRCISSSLPLCRPIRAITFFCSLLFPLFFTHQNTDRNMREELQWSGRGVCVCVTL